MDNSFDELFDHMKSSVDYQLELLRLSIVETIYDKMEDHKLNQTQLSKKMGCSRAMISKFLTGGNMTLKTIVKLAKALDFEWDIRIKDKNTEDN